jgi:ribokinase
MSSPPEAEPAIVVVGSTMIDMISYLERVPEAGETVRGRDFSLGFGGKGANQAVMASLLGAHVVMVNSLGDDVFGQMTIENFKRFGIEPSHLTTLPEMSSGVAPIWVDASGMNRIAIVPGANDHMTGEQVATAFSDMADPAVVLCQLEVPQAVIRQAFELGREAGAVNVLNPAPFARIDDAILALSDWLIPNEVEFAELTELLGVGANGGFDADVALIGAHLGTNLVVTRGELGATYYLRDGGETRHVPARRVTAVDSTGAGDAFVGAFAYSIAHGLGAEGAVTLGCACASQSVTRRGTQASFPRGDELAEIRNGAMSSGQV